MDHDSTRSAPATAAQVDDVLLIVASTYRATTDLRRRLARIAAFVGLVCAALALVAAAQSLQVRSAVEEVEDAALIDVVGVQIPDPRPAVERVGLRMRAALWGVGAVGLGLVALAAGGITLLIRPTPLPPDLEAVLRDPRRAGPRPPA